MPGGAPLRSASSKRPCKYGARVDGKCPKKPKAASGTASARSGAPSKRPCKYGARTPDGKCPKAPKKAKAATTVKPLKSVAGASRQAGEVLRSREATSSQKREAVKVLGAAVAAESGKKIAESAYESAKKKAASKSGRAAIKKAVKQAAPIAATVVRGGVATGAVLYAGGKALTANRARECRAWAKQQLALTEQRLGKQKLTSQQRSTLLGQYEEQCKKRPVTNSTLGK